MELITRKLTDIHPYEKNPRKNDAAVEAVAESIRQCTYVAPIIVDENGVILAGHTRYKALKKLGREEAEVIVKTGLTEEQKKKYRLLDNKTGELALWDSELLAGELEGLDFDGFDFDFLTKEDEKKVEGEVPFAEVLGEENNYIVLKFDNDVDWLQAESIIGPRTEKAYSTRKDGKEGNGLTGRKGVGRVIKWADFLEKVGVEL